MGKFLRHEMSRIRTNVDHKVCHRDCLNGDWNANYQHFTGSEQTTKTAVTRHTNQLKLFYETYENWVFRLCSATHFGPYSATFQV